MKVKYDISDEAIICLQDYVINRFETHKKKYEELNNQLNTFLKYLNKLKSTNGSPEKINILETEVEKLMNAKEKAFSTSLLHSHYVTYVLDELENNIIELEMR